MAPYVQVYWTKKKRTCFNGLTFCITRQSGTGKLHPSQEALFIFSTLFAYALDHIETVRHGLLFSNWPRMGRFHLRGLVKPRIWTSVITCKLDIVFQCATHNNSVVETSPTRDWDHLVRKRWRATACCGKSKFAISSGWLKGGSVCHPDDIIALS